MDSMPRQVLAEIANVEAALHRLTREQADGMLAGKVVAFDISGREYTGFMSLKK